jgi:eukaryotic-like serine/threonine-protein kinase
VADALERLSTSLAGRYSIDRQIGVGGMATVYLAHDERHDRQVALKLLRPELGAVIGADRFLAEIRTTAKLQHPHILPLFDSGEADGLLYYVMPYVEGVSLRDRLDREKQLAVPEAVRIAGEVASALDYAHRRSVIHRDIKPENILLHDGRALVADFGIALAVSNAGATRMTETGMSLGTPHYMSPEQAMGERELTARSDVYALGAVTYEMLTGEPPFTGPTAQAIVARVVTEEPRPLTPKRHTIPLHVEHAVLTALEKLPADRFATAAEFAQALKGAESYAAATARTPAPISARKPAISRKSGALRAAALLAAVSLAFAGGRYSGGPRDATAPVGRFVVSAGADHQMQAAGYRGVSISADGQTLIYGAQSARGLALYRRQMGELVAHLVAGTEGGVAPAVSPGGRWVAFLQGAAVRKVSLTGGAVITVATGTIAPQYIEWIDDEDLVVTGLDGALYRVPPSGEPTVIARPDTALREAIILPTATLAGGTRLLAIGMAGATGNGRLISIDARSGERTLILEGPISGAGYDPTGYLAWVLPDGSLMGARFDVRSSRIQGSPVTLAQAVRISVGGPPQFATSAAGTIAYLPEQPFELHLVTREGRGVPVTTVNRRFHSPRVSPDGRRIAVDFLHQGGRDVWMVDLRDNTLTRLTFDNDGHDPVWFPDGRRVAYATSRGGMIGMFARNVDGSGVADSLFVGGTPETVGAFTRDGREAVVITTSRDGSFDLSVMTMDETRRPQPLLASPFNEFYPAVSPDGRWLAYVSDESGQAEVYVRPFVGSGAKILVSQGGGTEPTWSRDGRSLHYVGFGRQGVLMMEAAFQASPEFRVTGRRELFDISNYERAVPHANYDVAPDGRFAMVYQGRIGEAVVIQNWPEEVRRRSATSR